jgi:hypothetical protein
VTVAQNLAIVVGSIAAILALMFLVRRLAQHFELSPEMQR